MFSLGKFMSREDFGFCTFVFDCKYNCIDSGYGLQQVRHGVMDYMNPSHLFQCNVQLVAYDK